MMMMMMMTHSGRAPRYRCTKHRPRNVISGTVGGEVALSESDTMALCEVHAGSADATKVPPSSSLGRSPARRGCRRCQGAQRDPSCWAIFEPPSRSARVMSPSSPPRVARHQGKSGDHGGTTPSLRCGVPRLREANFSRPAGTAAPLVSRAGAAREGAENVIMSYGVTSSGKTYTMEGTPSHPGLIPRACATLFEALRRSSSDTGGGHDRCRFRRRGATVHVSAVATTSRSSTFLTPPARTRSADASACS